MSNRQIPEQYKKINELLRQNDYSRSYWLPAFSRWGIYSANHPQIEANVVAANEWKPYTDNGYGFLPLQYKALEIIKKPYAKMLFDKAQIKYVVIPYRDLKNDDDIFIHHGNNRSFFEDNLDNISWLEKIGSDDGVTIYENKNYLPYFVAQSNVLSIESDSSFKNASEFLSKYGKFNDLAITKEDKPNAIKINDIYSDALNGKSIVASHEDVARSLVSLKSLGKIYYEIENGELKLFLSDFTPLVGNNKIVLEESKKDLITYTIKKDSKYSVQIDGSLIELKNENTKPTLLGVSKERLELFETGENPFYENDLNKISNLPKLSNCNSSVASPVVQSEVNDGQESGDGGAFLIKNGNTIACASLENISLNEVKDVLITYDYKIIGTKLSGLEIFNGKEKINKDFIKQNGVWLKSRISGEFTDASSSLDLKFVSYSDEQRKTTSETYIKNLKVYSAKKILDYTADSTVSEIEIPAKDLNLSISRTEELQGENLISNPSFEEGLWKNEVGDCNAHDDRPILGMDISNSGTDGSKSIVLKATRHTACTGPGEALKLKPGNKYKLSFDYKGINAKNAGYHIGFNNDQYDSISEYLPINSHDWTSYTSTFTVPFGSKNVDLVVYGYSDDEDSEVKTYYDNFNLIEVDDLDNRFILIDVPKASDSSPRVEWNSNNDQQTVKKLRITNLRNSFYLTSGELFHSNWKLAIQNSSKFPNKDIQYIAEDSHFKSDAWRNTWYFDFNKYCNSMNLCTLEEDGSYSIDLQVEFSSQRWLQVGVLISAVNFGALIIIGLSSYLRSRVNVG